MKLATKLGGMELEHPIMNAGGTCKTLEDVLKFVRSSVSAVVVGSITLDPRPGNDGTVYYIGPGWSLNSLGMPNKGRDYYVRQLKTMVAAAHNAEKVFILNTAGFTVQDYAALTQIAVEAGVDCVELNFGCPNVKDKGVLHRIASFDPSFMKAVLTAVFDVAGSVGVSVKLSPYSDPLFLVSVAQLLSEFDLCYVATSNTFPNAFALNPNGKSEITPGLAGLSGAALKPIALGQVLQFRQKLPARIAVVGVGGVETGRDVLDYLTVGATAVQASTKFWNANENPGVYGDILSSYTELFPEEG